MKYDDVLFDFVSADEEPSCGRGAVIMDGSQMTLDITTEDGDRYVIRGTASQESFAGKSSDGEVVLEWGKVGQSFLGIWLEGGYEYFLRFRLPGK